MGCPTRDGEPGANCDPRQAGTEASQTRGSVPQDPNQKSRAGPMTVTRFRHQPCDHETSPQSRSTSAGTSARHGQAQQRYQARSSVPVRAWARTAGKGLRWTAAPEPTGIGCTSGGTR